MFHKKVIDKLVKCVNGDGDRMGLADRIHSVIGIVDRLEERLGKLSRDVHGGFKDYQSDGVKSVFQRLTDLESTADFTDKRILDLYRDVQLIAEHFGLKPGLEKKQ
jgi:uncharacterized protein (UPF0335 family)